MHRLKIFASFLLLAVASAPAWSEQGSTVLPEVVVSATRLAMPALEAPAFTTVITAEQIEHSPAADLSQLLRERAGLAVSGSGAVGAVSTVSIRGSTSSQVLVLVNGVPLNSSRDGTVDLSQIPLDMVQRVEIVRGGEGSIYGTDAVGGVINIITKQAGHSSRLSARIENGSYLPHAGVVVSQGGAETAVAADPMSLLDTQRLSLSGATHLGAVGLSAAGGFARAANGFVWNDATYLGGWRRESHAGGLSGNGYLDLRAPLWGGTLAATGTLTTSAFDVPGGLASYLVTSSAEQQRTTARTTVSYATGPPQDRRLDIRSDGYYQYDLLHYADPATLPATDSTHRTDTAGGELTGRYRLSDLVSLTGGAGGRYDQLESTDVGAHSRLDLAGFASAEILPTARLSLTPSARYDYFSDLGGGISYRLGAVLALDDTSSLKGSLSHSYRVPTMNDLYWPSSAYATGNPALKPETAYAADFGYSVRSRVLSLDAALFARYILDQIVWAPTGNPLTSPWAPTNLGRSLIPGIELSEELRLPKGFSVSTSYSFIYSFLLIGSSTSYTVADNKRVPYVPLSNLSADVAYESGGTRVSIEGQYLSRVYTDDVNTLSASIAPHAVLNLRYLQQLGRSATLTVVLKNLLDSVYETQVGYPMPPFSVWTGIEVKL